MFGFVLRLLDQRSLHSAAAIHTPNLRISRRGGIATATVLAFRTRRLIA
jgi:hypothetical protein